MPNREAINRILHDFKYIAQEKKKLETIKKQILLTRIALTAELEEIEKNETILFKQLDELFLDIQNILEEKKE
ncbi:hypothetical protein DRN73_07160 [Candidatus Pacearchaeota archaeon]|nr:MAG: hypothetical protein DRN73_07160 [Candidatus Pacearchaeota archaeon]